MASTTSDLAHEIRRVVESPHPTQLQTLRRILLQSSAIQIETWALCYPCQIQTLVSEVLHALPRWQYTYDIVARLATVASIRDAMLQEDESLLHRVVESALDDFDVNSQYTIAALQLLHTRLPDHDNLPANVQEFLQQCFEAAAADPQPDLVRRLQHTLAGGARPSIASLAVSTLRSFESSVSKILRDKTHPEQQSMGLSCLAIMKTLIQGSRQEVLVSKDIGQMEAFFVGQKAMKTVQLVVLQVLSLCSSGSSVGHEEKVAQILTACDVLSAIDGEVLAEWSSRTPAPFRKLCEKAVQAEMMSAVRFSILSFTALLGPADHLPSLVIISYEQICSNLGSLDLPVTALSILLNFSLPRLSRQMSANFVRTLMDQVCAVLRRPDGGEAIMRSTALSAMIEALDHCGVEALPKNTDTVVDSSVQKFLACANAEAPRRSDSEECRSQVADKASAKLVRLASGLTLQLAFRQASAGKAIGIDLVQDLLIANARKVEVICSMHTRGTTRRIQSVHSFVDPPFDHDLPWRINLKTAMCSKLEQEYDLVESTVARVCADLEARCESVEGPLREERARTKDWESRYVELEEAYGQLESTLVDREQQVTDMEAQQQSHVQQLRAAHDETATLREHIEKIELDNGKLKENFDEERREMQETVRALQDQVELTRIERLNEVEVTKAASETASREMTALRFQLNEEQKKVHEASLATDEVLEEKSKLGDEMQLKEEELAVVKARLRSVEEAKFALSDIVSEREDQMKKIEQSRSALEHTMEDLKGDLEREKEAFVTQYRESAAQARQEWDQEKEIMQDKIRSARREYSVLETQHEELVREAEELSAKQRRKIEKLQKECAKREAQVAEVQELRQRLMLAMGLPTGPAPAEAPRSTLPIRSASSTAVTPAARHPFTPGTRAILSPSPTDAMLDTSPDSQHEPTPKRTKPRRSFQVPALKPAQDTRRKSVRSIVRPTTAQPRQPLSETSVNLSPRRQSPRKGSPVKMGFKDTRSASCADGEEMMDAWSFMGTVEGTPGAALGQTFDDETTVDLQ